MYRIIGKNSEKIAFWIDSQTFSVNKKKLPEVLCYGKIVAIEEFRFTPFTRWRSVEGGTLIYLIFFHFFRFMIYDRKSVIMKQG